MANNFWTAAPTQDPKRGFRFRVQITGLSGDGFIWYAKKATKPQISFTEASHQYLNHTYYWPARTEWNEVDITFVDPVDPDLAGSMADLLEAAGYSIPAGATDPSDFASMSKRGSTEALKSVIIEQVNEEGDALEKWTLNNAWVKEITFGDLDYSSDDLTELTMKLRYDWASLEPLAGVRRPEGPGNPKIFAGPY